MPTEAAAPVALKQTLLRYNILIHRRDYDNSYSFYRRKQKKHFIVSLSNVTPTTTVECITLPLAVNAGNDKSVCLGSSTTIGGFTNCKTMELHLIVIHGLLSLRF